MTTDPVALMSLLVSVTAMIVGVRAIARDKPDLRLTFHEAAAGNRYLQVVNVGLRPVRVESLAVRQGGPWPFGTVVRVRTGVMHDFGDAGTPPPVVIQQGEDVFLHYQVVQDGFDLSGSEQVMVQDAAGRLYALRRGV